MTGNNSAPDTFSKAAESALRRDSYAFIAGETAIKFHAALELVLPQKHLICRTEDCRSRSNSLKYVRRFLDMSVFSDLYGTTVRAKTINDPLGARINTQIYIL